MNLYIHFSFLFIPVFSDPLLILTHINALCYFCVSQIVSQSTLVMRIKGNLGNSPFFRSSFQDASLRFMKRLFSLILGLFELFFEPTFILSFFVFCVFIVSFFTPVVSQIVSQNVSNLSAFEGCFSSALLVKKDCCRVDLLRQQSRYIIKSSSDFP